MKKLLFMLLLSLGTITGASADTVQKLVVTKADGSVVKFDFSDAPVVSFTSTDVEIKVGGEKAILFPLSDYAKFTFEEEGILPDEVAEVVEEIRAEEFKIEGGNIRAWGLEPGSPVTIYSLDGKPVASGRADSNGDFSFSLSGANAGIYIVKTSKTTFKFLKK